MQIEKVAYYISTGSCSLSFDIWLHLPFSKLKAKYADDCATKSSVKGNNSPFFSNQRQLAPRMIHIYKRGGGDYQAEHALNLPSSHSPLQSVKKPKHRYMYTCIKMYIKDKL